jgi:transcriptional repressor NrdR
VVESRSADEGAAVRRRRECTACGFRFTTFERLAPTRLQVTKRSGRRQPFDAEKLRGALTRAAHKREVTAPQIAGIVDAVEADAAKRGGAITAERIGELCLERLGDIDRGAYFQFAGTLPEITPEIGVFAGADSVRGEEDSP